MTIEQQPYYLGSAETKLNTKGQVAIPARIRSIQPDDEQTRNYVIIRGDGDCLYMYTHRQFAVVKDNARRVAEELGNSGFYRAFMAGAYSVDIDTQGRFVLPQTLMRAASIVGPGILFIGVDDRIELWEPGVYEKTVGGQDNFEQLRLSTAKQIFGI